MCTKLFLYEDKDGNRPVEHYIDQLEIIAGSNKNARILLESIVYFFGWHGNRLVLLHHFRKETNKTPHREIEIAEKRMNDWIERFGSDRE